MHQTHGLWQQVTGGWAVKRLIPALVLVGALATGCMHYHDTAVKLPHPTTTDPPVTAPYVPPSTTTTTEAPTTTTTEASITTTESPDTTPDTSPDYTYTEPTEPPCPTGTVTLSDAYATQVRSDGIVASGKVTNDTGAAVKVNALIEVYGSPGSATPTDVGPFEATVPAHSSLWFDKQQGVWFAALDGTPTRSTFQFGASGFWADDSVIGCAFPNVVVQ